MTTHATSHAHKETASEKKHASLAEEANAMVSQINDMEATGELTHGGKAQLEGIKAAAEALAAKLAKH